MYTLSYFVALFTTLFVAFPAIFRAQALAAPHSSVAKARRAVDLSNADIGTFLDAHNTVRAQHGAPALSWSPSLAQKAAFWADLCLFRNSGGLLQAEPYGEHIVAATGDFPIRAAVGTFMADKDKYDPANPSYTHWTQVVWKSTTELGCAIASCRNALPGQPGRETLYVCLYNPAGNVIGQAPENVQL
ncbi:hypothetical protein EST38_g1179 [Candolleomyces aberdarensis]|uniref:SCP domain-containing protein n=1 Tax=Candolleomyces aberdarensis TaxID=2316362 RepID=A0A4V1Q583_9AGAR|nr:hypothetical protein EST38_g1179 [Candolleomyces aberdarensis]